ncbi:MAG: DEAD/DEAH box helicase [Cyclobacteriaceae bacterium]
MKAQQIILNQLEKVRQVLDAKELAMGEIIFNSGACQILSQSAMMYELVLSYEEEDAAGTYALVIEEDQNIVPLVDKQPCGWDRYAVACLLQVEHELRLLDDKEPPEYKKYSRKGMIKRVLKERWLKADKAEYKIKWADNIYGDHVLTNEVGVKYKVFLRDFDQETGYSDSEDAKYNKLGTTKHIMYTFRQIKENKSLYKRLNKTCPFIEVYCDPLNDYAITWYYPHKMPLEEQRLISKYFKGSNFIAPGNEKGFLGFIDEAGESDLIHIRAEVSEKLEKAFEQNMLDKLAETEVLDFTALKVKLFDYQKDGVSFALFRKAAVIADEMGLGKTIQAIGTAVLKKELFNFSKTLVVCPASIKEQWKNEVEKFCNEKAMVVQGNPDERALQYQSKDHFFFIVNYETVLRDQVAINKAGIDFLILDEAQRAKNFETKTAASLKRLAVKHKLVITGTPIENRLIDIYSIMGIIDPDFLGPLWEFSYQHCLFDPERPNKINGYYNLKRLNKRLDKVLIRREKRKIIDQLPNIQQKDVTLKLSPLQADYHASYAKGLAQIIRKKFLTPYDLKRMQLLLASMRMVCDSTYLIDDETHESPKLDELERILLNELDVKNQNRKIIIFSEWVKVHKLIGRMLRDQGIGFVELNGRIPVKSRGELIRKFEENPNYKIFLSTEAGGSGLNLQVADTLINFELPWNPAKKNQRIGRIDRLGQKSDQLTVINLITSNSIEQQIASGLLVKQSLFDGVLGDTANRDYVDFTTKGRSQFIQQLEEFVEEMEGQSELPPMEVEADSGEVATTPNESVERQQELDFSGDDAEHGTMKATPEEKKAGVSEDDAQQLEQVMNHGMQFLTGMFKMSTGKELGTSGQSIEIDKETGEVTMKFKLPV